MKKKVPIGISDFKKIIIDQNYYIDKTLMIKELLENGAQMILLPRPRRFGKTLNMTMLKYFFEKPIKELSKEFPGNKNLFNGLKIEKEECFKEQGQYPVVYLTFKDEKHSSFEKAEKSIKEIISTEYLRHDYLIESEILKEKEQKTYKQISNAEGDFVLYEKSLKNLIDYL